MQATDLPQFEALRQSMLREFLWMTPDNAQGFIVDLHNAHEDASLTDLHVTWQGYGLFAATGRFAGSAADCVAQILKMLDNVSYGEGKAGAAASKDAGQVLVSFATWTPEIGVATVRIKATSTGVIDAC